MSLSKDESVKVGGLVVGCALAEVFGNQQDKDRADKALDDWWATLPRVLSGVGNGHKNSSL